MGQTARGPRREAIGARLPLTHVRAPFAPRPNLKRLALEPQTGRAKRLSAPVAVSPMNRQLRWRLEPLVSVTQENAYDRSRTRPMLQGRMGPCDSEDAYRLESPRKERKTQAWPRTNRRADHRREGEGLTVAASGWHAAALAACRVTLARVAAGGRDPPVGRASRGRVLGPRGDGSAC